MTVKHLQSLGFKEFLKVHCSLFTATEKKLEEGENDHYAIIMRNCEKLHLFDPIAFDGVFTLELEHNIYKVNYYTSEGIEQSSNSTTKNTILMKFLVSNKCSRHQEFALVTNYNNNERHCVYWITDLSNYGLKEEKCKVTDKIAKSWDTKPQFLKINYKDVDGKVKTFCELTGGDTYVLKS